MASLNKVQLIGNLGNAPEVRSFPDGSRIATVSLATNDRWKDKQTGESKERSEWHNVVFAGPVVATVEKYLEKGATVYIEGRLRTRRDGRQQQCGGHAGKHGTAIDHGASSSCYRVVGPTVAQERAAPYRVRCPIIEGSDA